MRRGKPELLVAALIGVLLAWYVVYTQRVIVLLRADAKRSIEMYARVYRAFGDNTEVHETLARTAEHLRDNGVALDGLTYRLGRKLTFDAATESFVGDAEANRLLTRAYRAPFVVPDAPRPLLRAEGRGERGTERALLRGRVLV